MANQPQKQNAIKSQSLRYLSRTPYFDQAKHFNDDFRNLGYDYQGQLYKKTTSPELWSNPLQTSLFGRFEAIINFLLEQSKSIKKTFSYAHDKDSTQIN